VRYESNAKLLREHSEDPIQVFGLAIPRRELVQSAHDQKATLDALADLKCE
jgi:hypothetical protein